MLHSIVTYVASSPISLTSSTSPQPKHYSGVRCRFLPLIKCHISLLCCQAIIDQLKANWVWVPDWVDAPLPGENTAGRIVVFSKKFTIVESVPQHAVVHCTADTRYKLIVNGTRVALGPARSSPWIWYYDTIDLGPYLIAGENEIVVSVLRYFATMRGAMPFARTPFAGFTAAGSIHVDKAPAINLQSRDGWAARVDDSIHFPTGLNDDMFLHVRP